MCHFPHVRSRTNPYHGSHGRDGVPARLSGRLQPLGHRRRRARRRDRREPCQPGDARVHLREGAAVRPSASTATVACASRWCARRQGERHIPRVTWDEAHRSASAQAIERTRERSGAESILPFCYGGSNGLLTQDNTDARLFRRLGASRLLRTVCAAPTGAADRRSTARCRRSRYRLPARAPDRDVGREPVGIGHPPMPVHQGGAEGAAPSWSSSTRASTPLATSADLHLRRAARHRPGRRAGHAPRALRRGPRRPGVPRRARAPAPTRCARAPREWTLERAAAVAGLAGRRCARFADLYARIEPGGRALRLGPRAQPQRRQRRGGGPRAAGRRRQVRRARRRLHDEQLRVVGHRRAVADARPSRRRAPST